jgi:acyl carrier protein
MPSPKELTAYLKETVAELASMDAAEIKGSDRLREDLGLDSLQSMELLSRVSEKFNIDPDMEEVMKVQTIDEVVTALARVLPG